jgi:hypothetical protein
LETSSVLEPTKPFQPTGRDRAQRFVAADTYFEPAETIVAEILDDDDLYEWLTEDLGGTRYVVFNPVAPTVSLGRAVSIADLLGRLVVPEAE